MSTNNIKPTNVLAIDTSTKACVLAIQTAAGTLVDSEIVDRTHSREILPRIDVLLGKAELSPVDIDLIVYGQGPGSFTGLRIGVGVVQGFAFGIGKPVVGVSSMACLAQTSYRVKGSEHALVALVARKEEVYFGSYSIVDGYAELNGIEVVLEASEIPVQTNDKCWVGLGSGWQFQPLLQEATGVIVTDIDLAGLPEANELLALGIHRHQRGLSTSAMLARPEYVRETVANLPKPRQ